MAEEHQEEQIDDQVADQTTEQPEEPSEEVAVHPAARRMAMMDQIAASAHSEHLGETDESNDSSEPDQQIDAKGQTEPEEPTEPEEDQVAQQMGDQRVRVKVDGQEQDVALSELVRSFQINRAADARLQHATELLRTVQSAQKPETVDTVPETGPDLSNVRSTVEGKVKEALSKVFNEGEEAAASGLAEAMMEAIAGAVKPTPVTPPVDTNAIADAVAQQIEQRSALQEFLGTYQRIADNPYLQAAADDVLARIRSERPDLPFGEALKQSGDAVYRAFGYEQAAAKEEPQVSARADALAAKKAGMKPVPIRTGSSLPAQEQILSSEQARSATIAEMARRRQPQRA